MSEMLKSIAIGAVILGLVCGVAWALVGLRVFGNLGSAFFCVVAVLAICGVTGDAVRGRL